VNNRLNLRKFCGDWCLPSISEQKIVTERTWRWP